MTTHKPSSSGQRFTARQIRSMVFGWIILTVVAGVGTFAVLLWFQGGAGSPQGAAKSGPEAAVLEIVDPIPELEEQPQTVMQAGEEGDTTRAANLVEQEVEAEATNVVEQEGETEPEQGEPTEATAISPVVLPASTGFGLGGQVIHGGLLALDKMQSIGMGWVKIKNHDLGGGTLDGDIQNTHANGLRILISVKDNAGHQLITDPGYQQQFIRYLERAARAGADAIEVWNEPNLDREWPADEMGGEQYTALLQNAYPRIKAANANTMVVSAALSPTGAFGGSCGSIDSIYGCDDKPFLEAMVNAGALNYLDCVGMHYNEGLLPPSATSGDPRSASGHYTRYFKGMLDTYNAILAGTKPICITELGYLSGEEWGYLPPKFSWSPPINMTVAQHADYLGQAVILARQMGTIRLMIIFNVDFAVVKSLGDDPQAGYSIVRPDQSCPACQTIAAAMQQ